MEDLSRTDSYVDATGSPNPVRASSGTWLESWLEIGLKLSNFLLWLTEPYTGAELTITLYRKLADFLVRELLSTTAVDPSVFSTSFAADPNYDYDIIYARREHDIYWQR